jgi:hypothetical protein
MRRMRWMWRRRLLRTLGTVPYLLNFRPIGYKAFGMRARGTTWGACRTRILFCSDFNECLRAQASNHAPSTLDRAPPKPVPCQAPRPDDLGVA